MVSHVHIRTHMYTRTRVHMHTRAHTHAHKHTSTHTRTRTHIHTCTHAEACTRTHRNIQKYLKQPIPSNIDTKEHQIFSKLIKENCLLAPILLNNFNNNIVSQTFPDKLKLADVIPLHKKDDRTLKTNYRPVNLLSTIPKFMKDFCSHS